MPEGDVVRLTAARLDEALAGREIVRAELRWPSAAEADLTGTRVVANVPYGKHLLTRLDDGRTLHTHLRMDGAWHVARTGTGAARGTGPAVRVVLANRWWTAIGTRIGMLDVLRTRDERLITGPLGPDVLADDFPTVGVHEAVRRFLADDAVGGRGPRHRPERVASGVPVAEALLDQHLVAGLGTIWTAESLHACTVGPWTSVRALRPSPELSVAELLLTARRLMQHVVALGFGPEPDGGRRVHGRAGRACRSCGTPVAVGAVNEPPFDRPIFYCPSCQPPAPSRSTGGR